MVEESTRCLKHLKLHIHMRTGRCIASFPPNHPPTPLCSFFSSPLTTFQHHLPAPPFHHIIPEGAEKVRLIHHHASRSWVKNQTRTWKRGRRHTNGTEHDKHQQTFPTTTTAIAKRRRRDKNKAKDLKQKAKHKSTRQNNQQLHHCALETRQRQTPGKASRHDGTARTLCLWPRPSKAVLCHGPLADLDLCVEGTTHAVSHGASAKAACAHACGAHACGAHASSSSAHPCFEARRPSSTIRRAHTHAGDRPL